MLKIGERIRQCRRDRGLSQGDIEQRTGLLRCYLSRVENGHTVPSLQTLAKIARALEIPLAHFFSDNENGKAALPQLSEHDMIFLQQLYSYTSAMKDKEREQLLAMVKRMATEPASN